MKDFFTKILFILTNRDKKFLLIIALLMLISALLDLIGVSAILPIVSLLTYNSEFIPPGSGGFIELISKITGITKVVDMSYLLLAILGIFYIIKTAYLFFYTYVVTKFTMSISRRLTKRQMDTYLSMPYEYHLNNNSSTLIRKSVYDVNNFTSAVTSILDFFVKSITLLAITVYLFVTDWIVASIVGGALLVFSLFIIFILKPHIRAVSLRNQQLNSENYKYLSQAFNGIKESKISNTEEYFVNCYDSNIININKMSLKNTMYNRIPGLSLELVGMFGLLASLVIIITVKSNSGSTDYSDIISKFSAFAYAIIKLLPCVVGVNTMINNIGWYKASIDSIYHDITEAEKLQDSREYYSKNFEPLHFEKSIQINNLCFAYSSVPDKEVLTNINCIIKKNSSVAFCGTSGAGKTTLIDNILGLLTPQKGTITVDGVDIHTNMKGWRTNIAYIPQTIYLMDDSIRRNIAFGLSDKDIDENRIWDALEKAQLKDFVKGLKRGLDTVIGERGVRLSGGQRQRIGIARAFYRNTNIVVFDEATSALDYETEKNILDHVNQYAKDHTLIIITHRLNTIEGCDKIYKIGDTKIEEVK